MKIKMRLIPDEGMRLQGEEPATILDIQEPLFRFEQPIHYDLEAHPVGGRGLSVRGRLWTTARACCVRTLEWFDLPLAVEDFQFHSDSVAGDEADLTPEIREDILLILPANPVSSRTQPVECKEPGPSKTQNETWKKLDQLKIPKQETGN